MYSERDKKQQVGFKSGNGKRLGMYSMQEQQLAKVPDVFVTQNVLR
jgi:hypothetical protein